MRLRREAGETPGAPSYSGCATARATSNLCDTPAAKPGHDDLELWPPGPARSHHPARIVGERAVPLAPRDVGLDLFGDRTVDFDLPHKRISLLAQGARPAGEDTQSVAASTTTGNLLTVPVTIGEVTATAVIDTGARKTRINWALGRLLGLDPAKLAKGDVIQGATNKAVETGATRISNVRLGSRVLAHAPVLVADLPVFETFGVAGRPAMVLGLDWLDRTRMVIDFPGRKVWFEAVEVPAT